LVKRRKKGKREQEALTVPRTLQMADELKPGNVPMIETRKGQGKIKWEAFPKGLGREGEVAEFGHGRVQCLNSTGKSGGT